MLLKDKIAIVTGAAQGIGKAIAKMYSEHGAIVVLCDIQEDKVKAAAEEIEKETGRKAVGLSVDVTNSEQVNAVVKKH